MVLIFSDSLNLRWTTQVGDRATFEIPHLHNNSWIAVCSDTFAINQKFLTKPEADRPWLRYSAHAHDLQVRIVVSQIL